MREEVRGAGGKVEKSTMKDKIEKKRWWRNRTTRRRRMRRDGDENTDGKGGEKV